MGPKLHSSPWQRQSSRLSPASKVEIRSQKTPKGSIARRFQRRDQEWAEAAPIELGPPRQPNYPPPETQPVEAPRKREPGPLTAELDYDPRDTTCPEFITFLHKQGTGAKKGYYVKYVASAYKGKQKWEKYFMKDWLLSLRGTEIVLAPSPDGKEDWRAIQLAEITEETAGDESQQMNTEAEYDIDPNAPPRLVPHQPAHPPPHAQWLNQLHPADESELGAAWHFEGRRRWKWLHNGKNVNGWIEFGRNGALRTSFDTKKSKPGYWKIAPSAEGDDLIATFGNCHHTLRLVPQSIWYKTFEPKRAKFRSAVPEFRVIKREVCTGKTHDRSSPRTMGKLDMTYVIDAVPLTLRDLAGPM